MNRPFSRYASGVASAKALANAGYALVLWIPGVIWIAERIYMRISRNRHLLSRIFGCKEACAIMPSRKRLGEPDLEVQNQKRP